MKVKEEEDRRKRDSRLLPGRRQETLLFLEWTLDSLVLGNKKHLRTKRTFHSYYDVSNILKTNAFFMQLPFSLWRNFLDLNVEGQIKLLRRDRFWVIWKIASVTPELFDSWYDQRRHFSTDIINQKQVSVK